MTTDIFNGAVDLDALRTPAYVVFPDVLERNLKLIKDAGDACGARVLLALKAFSMYETFGLISKYLCGTTSSCVHEALLAKEYFGGEIHVYCPAFREDEVRELAEFCDCIVFNSEAQIDKFSALARSAASSRGRRIHIGLRANPEYSEVATQIYNPCASGSRLGALRANLSADIASKIDALHFHALCEQDSGVLERTLAAFEEKFGDIIARVRSVNFGGGHHITRPDYGIERLVDVVRGFRARYPNVEDVYLEPGEAVALNAGVFAARVLEITDNGGPIAILDCSAVCHMPDVLEMPYRPAVFGAELPGRKAHTYRLCGRSCLAGDRIGDYSFDAPLREGDILFFADMAIYTMVKTNTFNGMPLPDICLFDSRTGNFRVVKSFGYGDFKGRL